MKWNDQVQYKTTTCKNVLHSSQAEGKRECQNSLMRFNMFYTCVEVRVQNMQKFYAISLINGRPDLTTENHWMKI